MMSLMRRFSWLPLAIVGVLLALKPLLRLAQAGNGTEAWAAVAPTLLLIAVYTPAAVGAVLALRLKGYARVWAALAGVLASLLLFFLQMTLADSGVDARGVLWSLVLWAVFAVPAVGVAAAVQWIGDGRAKPAP